MHVELACSVGIDAMHSFADRLRGALVFELCLLGARHVDVVA